MSLLRLLSKPASMGDDAVDRSQAWRTFDQLWADERVLWADEPDELDAVWRAISARDDKSHKLWYAASYGCADSRDAETRTTLIRQAQRGSPSPLPITRTTRRVRDLAVHDLAAGFGSRDRAAAGQRG
jgi:hypothetical protein